MNIVNSGQYLSNYLISTVQSFGIFYCNEFDQSKSYYSISQCFGDLHTSCDSCSSPCHHIILVAHGVKLKKSFNHIKSIITVHHIHILIPLDDFRHYQPNLNISNVPWGSVCMMFLAKKEFGHSSCVHIFVFVIIFVILSSIGGKVTSL